MPETRLNIEELGDLTLTRLLTVVEEAENGLVLEVPCFSIGNANSHLDVASDYLNALFVGESVTEFCEEASFFSSWGQLCMSVCFVLRPSDARGLAESIRRLAPGFDGDLWWGDQDFEDVHFSIIEFAETLEERTLRFPELADNYLANHLAGWYDLDVEQVEEECEAYPERRHGVWRSFASKNVGYDFFVSNWYWIVPRGKDLKKLLRYYGGFEDGVPGLEPAQYLTVNHLRPVVYHRSSAMFYPQRGIHSAQACAAEIWSEARKADDLHALVPEEDEARMAAERPEAVLSEGGDILVASDRLASYVLFADSLQKVPLETLEECLDEITNVTRDLRRLVGKSAEISCRWDDLTDEQFEELCYHVIGESERYDPNTIRKIGKARSRDGGRDIEIFSRGRAGKLPVKWVIQCKLLKGNSSLGGSKVEVSDTVDQYGAGGYCVMTSGLIDATLYDKLDRIADNKGIEVGTWSRLELETFLVRKPHIKERYFGR